MTTAVPGHHLHEVTKKIVNCIHFTFAMKSNAVGNDLSRDIVKLSECSVVETSTENIDLP